MPENLAASLAASLRETTANLAAATPAPVFCPGGCGCRLGTNDADRFECGCDEGCCNDPA